MCEKAEISWRYHQAQDKTGIGGRSANLQGHGSAAARARSQRTKGQIEIVSYPEVRDDNNAGGMVVWLTFMRMMSPHHPFISFHHDYFNV